MKCIHFYWLLVNSFSCYNRFSWLGNKKLTSKFRWKHLIWKKRIIENNEKITVQRMRILYRVWDWFLCVIQKLTLSFEIILKCSGVKIKFTFIEIRMLVRNVQINGSASCGVWDYQTRNWLTFWRHVLKRFSSTPPKMGVAGVGWSILNYFWWYISSPKQFSGKSGVEGIQKGKFHQNKNIVLKSRSQWMVCCVQKNFFKYTAAKIGLGGG